LAASPSASIWTWIPAFNQLWHAAEGIDRGFSGHTLVTVGLNVGHPECPVPTCGKTWITTLPPVVLAHWPIRRADYLGRFFTTVGNWRGYGSIEHQGVFYGQKPFLALTDRSAFAERAGASCRPCRFIRVRSGLEALSANGWRLLDPVKVAGTPALYHTFIEGSRAEFGLTKSGYVVSQCGWFSDRSACYLASGRPVLAQGHRLQPFSAGR